ncbi:MAG: hypothetical protein MO846_07025 [Candidatus Devosia symbiotica]|nr:hypothetical protein [Candidatus Devosia symbiotica]
MDINRAEGLRAIGAGGCRIGIGIIDNQLQHCARQHTLTLRPDFMPALVSDRKDGADEPALIAGQTKPGQIHLRHGQAIAKNLCHDHGIRRCGDVAETQSQNGHFYLLKTGFPDDPITEDQTAPPSERTWGG